MSEHDDAVDAELVEGGTAVPTPLPSDLPAEPATDYTEDGVPTFDYVRDQIEKRYGTAVGSTELAEDASQTDSLDERLAAREQAGRDRLEEIRRAMREE